MSKSLKIAIFGNDMFTFKTASTLCELFKKSKMENEYHAIIPEIETNAAKDSPIKLYTEYIKDNEMFRKKPLKKEWKLMHKYFEEIQPNYGIICGLPSFDNTLLKHFSQKILLAQPSILPNFAGMDPISHAIFNKMSSTGLTIGEIVPDVELFRSPIIYQEEILIDKSDNYSSLAQKIGNNAGTELAKIITEIEQGNTFQADKQEKEPIKCEKINRIFSVLNEDADKILLLYKSLEGHNYPPATFVKLKQEIALLSLQNPEICKEGNIFDTLIKENPGTLYWNFQEDESALYIKCKDGIIKSKGLRLMQARRQSRGTSPKYFVKTVLKGENEEKNMKQGKINIFDTGIELENFVKYRNLVDKKFQYLVSI